MLSRSGVWRLTPREQEVALRIARGRNTAQIARDLVISIHTVRQHIKHILSKLDFHNRAQIAAWVTRQSRRRHPEDAADDDD